MSGMVDAMKAMKNSSMVLLSESEQRLAAPYFDFLIQGLQTPN